MAVRKAGAGEAWGAWAQACSSEIEPVGVLEACMKSPMNLTASSRIDRSERARSSRCELPAELPATAPPFSWDDSASARGASASRWEGKEGACTDARAREAARRSREAGRREAQGCGEWRPKVGATVTVRQLGGAEAEVVGLDEHAGEVMVKMGSITTRAPIAGVAPAAR